MKRQRKKQGPTTSSEKKIKTEEEKMAPEEEEEWTPPPPPRKEEETEEDKALELAASAAEEEMELVRGLGLKDIEVDEQMSWGTVWLPFWDVEFVGRNYGALFSDVVWDDDIWNLRTGH